MAVSLSVALCIQCFDSISRRSQGILFSLCIQIFPLSTPYFHPFSHDITLQVTIACQAHHLAHTMGEPMEILCESQTSMRNGAGVRDPNAADYVR